MPLPTTFDPVIWFERDFVTIRRVRKLQLLPLRMIFAKSLNREVRQAIVPNAVAVAPKSYL